MKKKGLFSSKKSNEFFENETEDFYYGIQSKSINDLRKGFDATGEIMLEEIKFAALFDKNKKIEVIKNEEDDISNTQKVDLQTEFDVEKARSERAKRVLEIAKSDDIDVEALTEEFGVTVNLDEINGDTVSEQFKEEITAEKPIKVIVDNTEKIKKTKNSEEKEEQTDISKYRDKIYPLHIINIDVLQSVIEKESEAIEKKTISKTSSKKKKSDGINVEIKRNLIKLKNQMVTYTLQMIACLLLTVIMFSITAINNSTSVNFNATSFLVVNLIMLLVGTVISYKTVIGGIVSLFNFKANSDSSVSIAFVAVLVHLGFCLFDSSLISSGLTYVYTHIVLLAYFFNFLGKYIKTRRIYGNIRYVGSREQKYSVKIFDEYNVSLKLADDTLTGAPVIAYQKKCKNMDEFFKLSNMPDPSDYATRTLAPLSLVLSMGLCIIAIIMYKSVNLGMGVLAASCCMSLALTNTIVVNLPVRILCKKIRQSGAMISNYESVEYLSRINAVMVDGTDVFPSGSTVLEGVKTFGNEDKEEPILCAKSLMNEVGGVLSNVLNQVVDDTEKEYLVESYILEDDLGVSGIVNGNEVLVGTRTMILNHGIELPEKDGLSQYVEDGRNEILIALNGEFSTMLILSYKADRRKKNEIKKLEQSGVSIIVRATDPNITKELISNKFGISQSSVNVISGNLGNVYKKVVDGIDDYAPAMASTKGRVESLAGAIYKAKPIKEQINALVSAQTMGSLIGFMIALVITVLSIDKLTPFIITWYLLAWSLVMLVVAKIKR